MEGIRRFNARRYCSAKCAKQHVRATGVGYQALSLKPCEKCGVTMDRRRCPGGTLESPVEYRRRRFCSLQCAGPVTGAARRKPVVGWSQAHKRAREALALTPCSQCGSERTVDRHHLNEDIQDNRLENLGNLCRSCHMLKHSNAAACTVPNCPDMVSGPKSTGGFGMCPKHYTRWKRHGNPLMVKRNQYSPVVLVER